MSEKKMLLGQLKLILKPLLLVIVICWTSDTSPAESMKDPINQVSVSKPFFNPTLDQKIKINFSLSHPGALTVQILDRDGVLVRSLLKESAEAGAKTMEWDGRNDLQQIVPNESYNLRIGLENKGKTETYFPANKIAEELKVQIDYYDRQQSIISYKLPKAARVHLQAGCAKKDPKTGKLMGPVMKNVVAREPRAPGTIAETWNGYDESGTIYIADLPNFTTAIAATALPDNSILVTGGRSKTFVDSVSERKGKSFFTFSVADHRHHRGLPTLEDTSPDLVLQAPAAEWSDRDKVWRVRKTPLLVQGNLQGPSTSSFVKQPGAMWVFIDGEIFRKLEPLQQQFSITIPNKKLSSGVHIVSVNAGSDYGPTSANSMRFEVNKDDHNRIAKE